MHVRTVLLSIAFLATTSPLLRAQSIELASVDSSGQPGFGQSGYSSISAQGRFVVFNSGASNLVPGDTNEQLDVFVHDRLTGETTRVSVSSTGEQGNRAAGGGDISSDGRFVAFDSYAFNLVPNDTNSRDDVFLHDRVTAVTVRISVAADGTQGDRDCIAPKISSDGRVIVFTSEASNLVPGDNNHTYDVFAWERTTGKLERVSINTQGEEGNRRSEYGSISADGRYVAFQSFATNLVPGDRNKTADIFVRDRLLGTTTRVSVNSRGEET